MVILNKLKFTEVALKIDWKVIFFFVALFILIGCMEIVGLFTILEVWGGFIFAGNQLISAIIMLLMIGILSGVLAQVPTALVFITLLERIYGIGNVPDIILMGFLFGINLGSNFLPQGAAVDLMALNLARKNKITGFNYKTLLKNGSMVTVFHIINSIIYMTIYALIMGII
jgi:Na+/H+ antiporter NhaD/arsenite permease-like protein